SAGSEIRHVARGHLGPLSPDRFCDLFERLTPCPRVHDDLPAGRSQHQCGRPADASGGPCHDRDRIANLHLPAPWFAFYASTLVRRARRTGRVRQVAPPSAFREISFPRYVRTRHPASSSRRCVIGFPSSVMQSRGATARTFGASRSWLIQRRSPPSAVAGDRNVPRIGTPCFVRLSAIEASSPRRSSFPIRRTIAPRSVTRTGSWTKIASARASCGSSWYQTSAPEDRNISTSAACSVRAATKSGRPVYPQIFGSAWAKALSGRRTRTVRRGSTMLWLPYDPPTLTSSREALAALSSSPKSSSIFGAARSGQDSSSAPDVDPGDGPLDRLPDHPQRWKEDPRPRPGRVAGGRRQGDPEGRRLRPRVRLPTDRHRENVRERTGRR